MTIFTTKRYKKPLQCGVALFITKCRKIYSKLAQFYYKVIHSILRAYHKYIQLCKFINRQLYIGTHKHKEILAQRNLLFCAIYIRHLGIWYQLIDKKSKGLDRSVHRWAKFFSITRAVFHFCFDLWDSMKFDIWRTSNFSSFLQSVEILFLNCSGKKDKKNIL